MSDEKNSEKDWGKVRDELDLNPDMDFNENAGPSEETASSEGALEHPSYSDLEAQLTQAEQKAHEHWEKSVRALAELDNVRRRAERDVSHAHRYGLEKFVNALLPVVDSLEQALQLARQAEDSAMLEGLELTMKLFLDVLQKHEVEQVDPQGLPFDPTLHEAMSMQVSDEVPANAVLTVFQKGYKLHDRVIRPARVIVSKGMNS